MHKYKIGDLVLFKHRDRLVTIPNCPKYVIGFHGDGYILGIFPWSHPDDDDSHCSHEDWIFPIAPDETPE